MHQIFDFCVDLLYKLAHITGMTYEAINVILFVFVHPAITAFLLYKYYKCRAMASKNNAA